MYFSFNTHIGKGRRMKEITLLAPAKVNVALDVVGKRQDGYHLMRMINHSTALADVVTLKKQEKGITVSSDDDGVPTDQRNIVVKIAQRLQRDHGITAGVHIHIEKHIPMQAGLAGGSADGAAALMGLNQLWKLKLCEAELCDFGAAIGADIPYCCTKGTALVEGIGERITPLPPLAALPILVVKPQVDIATPWAFQLVDQEGVTAHPDLNAMVHALKTQGLEAIAGMAGNVFEPVIFKRYPAIAALKESLLEQGAFLSVMSGSGSTVVGYFNDHKTAEAACAFFLKQNHQAVFLTSIE